MKKIRKMLTTAAMLAAFAFTALPANAELQALGAVNPATGYPLWYQDTNGLALSLCLDQNGFCLLPGVFVYPADRTGINSANFPVESFYYMADTSGVSPLGVISLTLYEAAVEGGFIGAVVDGGQAAFTRIRIRADVTVPGTYTVTHPYGVNTYTVASIGAGLEINDTVDVPGLVLAPFDQNHPSLAGTPPLLPQNVGPFLRRADGLILTDPTNASNRYIGLPGQPVAVTGSPTGNNFVRITGGGDTLQLDTFGLMGKITAMEISPASADVGIWKLNSPSTPATFTLTNLTGLDIPQRDVLAGAGLIFASDNPVFSIPLATDTCAAGVATLPPANTCTFGVVLTAIADGPQSATITISSAGNPNTSVTVTGTADGIPPTLTVGQTVFTNTLTATISGTATDNIAVHDIDVSLGGVSQGTSTVTNGNWSFIASGFTLNAPNVFTVTAVDTALPLANGNTATQNVTVTHDNILPAVNLTSPAPGLTNNNIPALTFTATDTNFSAATVKVDGVIVQKVSGNTLDQLPDGQHTVVVDALDAAGNTSSGTSTITVDTIPPAITVTSPKIVNARVGQTNPALTFSVTDANNVPANTTVTLDGTPVPAGTATIGPFTAGSAHTLVVSSTDGANNITTTTLPFTIVLSDGRIVTLGASEPTIADALAALRHVVNLAPLSGDAFAHGDVAPLDANGIPNPNGTVDITDALVILRKIVGLITTF